MDSRASKRLGLALVGALLTLLACSPTPTSSGTRRVYGEPFDGTCHDLPCGWTQVTGPAGAAHTTSTLLPGLRGLALEGDGVLVDGPAAPSTTSSFVGGSLDLVLLARCDAGASLTVRVALTSTSLSDASSDTAASLLEAHVIPAAEWDASGAATDGLRQTLTPVLGPRDSVVEVHVQSVTVRKEGPGACDLDALRIEHIALDSFGDYYGGCV